MRSVNKKGGYSATVDTHGGGVRSVVLQSGPVHIENNLSKIEMLMSTAEWSVVNCLWLEVMKIYNNANKNMKTFLTEHFGVRELHPFIETFEESTSPSELLERLKKSLS